jgi:hypothetical protein
MIFPRYHQLDCVRKLEADARAKGAGCNYLIQHSAGSGKSNSIGWLAHRLAFLHTDQDKKVFDSVVVITDRVVLDQQLQETIYQFEHKHGVVQKIDENTAQLARALREGVRPHQGLVLRSDLGQHTVDVVALRRRRHVDQDLQSFIPVVVSIMFIAPDIEPPADDVDDPFAEQLGQPRPASDILVGIELLRSAIDDVAPLVDFLVLRGHTNGPHELLGLIDGASAAEQPAGESQCGILTCTLRPVACDQSGIADRVHGLLQFGCIDRCRPVAGFPSDRLTGYVDRRGHDRAPFVCAQLDQAGFGTLGYRIGQLDTGGVGREVQVVRSWIARPTENGTGRRQVVLGDPASLRAVEIYVDQTAGHFTGQYCDILIAVMEILADRISVDL